MQPKLLCSRSASAKSEPPASSTAVTLPLKATFQRTPSPAGTRSLSLPKSSDLSRRISLRFCSRLALRGVDGRHACWAGTQLNPPGRYPRTLIRSLAAVAKASEASSSAGLTAKQTRSRYIKTTQIGCVAKRRRMRLIGLRLHETEPASAVQRTPFRSRDHHALC